MMTIDEINRVLSQLPLPSFVAVIRGYTLGFNTHTGVGRDYHLHIELRAYERNAYRSGATFLPISNHPFNFPTDSDELRAQVVAAILMAVAHETIEQISDGGEHFCDPHRHAGGTAPDTAQWLGLLDSLHGTIRGYAATMPAW